VSARRIRRGAFFARRCGPAAPNGSNLGNNRATVVFEASVPLSLQPPQRRVVPALKTSPTRGLIWGQPPTAPVLLS
jgi:hypothetical protein